MKKADDLDASIMKLVSERPMSVSQLAKELNLRRDFLAGYLEALKTQGKLKKIEVGRSYVYQPDN
jgi:predicted transcriptional regulator